METNPMVMTDEELICDFMEPKPVGSWMRDIQPTWWYYSTYDLPIGWHVKTLTLDALWEVEERLSDIQWHRNGQYTDLLVPDSIGNRLTMGMMKQYIHATAAQKIKALASVLRNGK